MAMEQAEQCASFFTRARHVLVVFRADSRGDAIATACALAQFVEGYDCRVDMASDNFSLPPKLLFLPRSKDIQSKLSHLQQFMITVDIKDAGVRELSYDVKEEKLHIFVTPKSGMLTREHIRTAQSEFRYDLIITIGTQDLESLGDLYTKNRALFEKVPIINIDVSSANEHFGAINIVDMTASSTGEILARLMIQMNEQAITRDIATALLAGMIVKTNSFKHNHIRPQTLAIASKLVSMGADREYIITHLYRTKSLSMLRLWGEALAHMNYDKELGLISTCITREDFARSGAGEQELYDIIEELIINSPEERMTLLLHEHKDAASDRVHGILHVEQGLDALSIAESFHPTGDASQASFSLSGINLKKAEETVIEEIHRKHIERQ